MSSAAPSDVSTNKSAVDVLTGLAPATIFLAAPDCGPEHATVMWEALETEVV